MRILITTDSFPPGCGGSGWSTYELARALRARGHEIVVVQPRPGRPQAAPREYDGFVVREFAARAPNLPFVRNYYKNERLTAVLTPFLRDLIRDDRIEVVHAQHVLSGPPSIAAARAEGVPVVCTIRDYWPVCYWSDLIHDYTAESLCPGCSPVNMRRCVRPRAGHAWPIALPLVPYMRANLARKQASLAEADALIAVSSAIACDLIARAPELGRVPIETIPNPINLAAIEASADVAASRLRPPYALYVGKLAVNKGIAKLLVAIERADLRWPLVIIGEGPERARTEDAVAKLGRDIRLTGWLPREEVIGWMRHASLLAFPSHGPESLSRVLLEASALGLPIAAMDTGGTSDIIRHEVTGLLSRSAEELGEHIARLTADGDLAARLGRAARDHVRAFDAAEVAARVERLYEDLTRGRRARAATA